MWSFQGIISIWARTYREIFKSVLVFCYNILHFLWLWPLFVNIRQYSAIPLFVNIRQYFSEDIFLKDIFHGIYFCDFDPYSSIFVNIRQYSSIPLFVNIRQYFSEDTFLKDIFHGIYFYDFDPYSSMFPKQKLSELD